VLQRNPANLSSSQIIRKHKHQLHTFFMEYPPFINVLQTVDTDTETPQTSWSSRRSSSRYISGVDASAECMY
jgi:hypothetical protein